MTTGKTDMTAARAPFIKRDETVRSMMADVMIAAIPAAVWAVWRFGPRAAAAMLVSVLTAIASEAAFPLITHSELRIGDLSAAVTGLLCAFCLPASAPIYAFVCASAFAIIIAKCAFGGIGANIFNPALAGVVFARLCFSGKAPLSGDLVTLAAGGLPSTPMYDAVVGATDGALGEVSALLILAGGVYLLFRGVISWQTPLAFIATAAALAMTFPANASSVQYTMYEMFSGSLILGAIFLTNDPTTTPSTGVGRLIFGAGCGALTFVMRRWGGDPDGVAYAILTMNMLTGAIDRLAAVTLRRTPRGGENES